MKSLKLLVISGFIVFSPLFTKAQQVITLDDAMLIARQKSPNIIKARLSMEQNRELLNAQLASLKSRFALDVTPFAYSKTQTYNDFYSQYYNTKNLGSNGAFSISQPIKFADGTLSFRNEFSYFDNSSETAEGTRDNKGYDMNLYLQYDQPIFKYNQTKMDLRKVELNLENATLSYAIEMLSLEQSVNQSFYNVYQKQTALTISTEELKNQEKSYDIIKAKVEGDLSAKEELYQAELNLANSQSNYENAIVDLDNAMDDFKKLIGIPILDDIKVSTNIEYKQVVVNLNTAIEKGLSQRMELSQREISLQNARFNLIETSETNSFSGDIRLSYGITGNDEEISNLFLNPTKSPRASVTLSIPIFDWGARKARIRAAEISVQSQEIDFQSQKNDIIINIRKTYRNLNNLIRQINIAEQNERNAQLTYEINLERYRNGDLTSIDLEVFQTQLSDSKTKRINALINYKLELLNMKIQSLWDFENNTSFVPKEVQINIKK